MDIDQLVDRTMRPVADAVSGFIFFPIPLFGAEMPLVVLWLVAGGLFFTVYLRFINVRGFAQALRIVSGRYAQKGDPGEISQFSALATAVSGTVGIGNMAGVAVAISTGGPGATFWLMAAGLLGMSSKFAECTLGVLYRRRNPDGSVSGGPMHYLERGLGERGWPALGRRSRTLLRCRHGVRLSRHREHVPIESGPPPSSSTSPAPTESFFAGRGWLFGLFLAAVVALVIIGGIQSIARTTVKLVPTMALLYVSLALLTIVLNADRLPGAIAAIWNGAFTSEGMAGGGLGALVIGFRRAVFSNEAGLGSAAIAHATARTPQPASEGFVALLEPFIDTVVICTLSALVITTTVYDPALATGDISGIELTTRAFASTLPWSPVPLAVAAILFAFSTMIAWAYYGLKAFTYLAGEGRLQHLGFNAFFCAFVVVGASLDLGALIDLSDALVFVIAIPNLIGLYAMAPVVRRELARYRW